MFSLAHLTVLSLPPPAMIEVAARTGYGAVGLRLLPATEGGLAWPLMDDPPALRATRAAMAATGLRVQDIEFVKLEPRTQPAVLLPVLEAGGELGARYLIAAPYDPDLARLADRLAALCDLAAPFGLSVVLEFFPWTAVASVAAADAVVTEAGRGNAGVLVDMLHFDRGPSTLAQLDAMPSSRLPFAHLCDAPAGAQWTEAQLLHTARAERLPPGEGGIDIAAVLAHLPPGIALSLEVPMTALTAEQGAEAVARRVHDAARRTLDNLRETGRNQTN